MVPMRMSNQNMCVDVFAVFHQLVAEVSNARARV